MKSSKPKKLFKVLPEENVLELEQINKEMQEYDQQREKIIKESREILKLSKKAIFSIHRGDMKTASSQLEKSETKAKELLEIVETSLVAVKSKECVWRER